QNLLLQGGNVLVVDERVVSGGNWIFPEQLFRGNLRAEPARSWAHVAMQQLKPGPGECVGQLIWILEEAARDLLVRRVEAQRKVARQHSRLVLLAWIVGIRDESVGILGHPLVCTSGALRQ